MIQFSVKMYEMVAKEICKNVCAVTKNREERMVEIDWNGVEMLFRFMAYVKNGRIGIECAKMVTFRGGVLVSNDFEAEWIRRLL